MTMSASRLHESCYSLARNRVIAHVGRSRHGNTFSIVLVNVQSLVIQERLEGAYGSHLEQLFNGLRSSRPSFPTKSMTNASQ